MFAADDRWFTAADRGFTRAGGRFVGAGGGNSVCGPEVNAADEHYPGLVGKQMNSRHSSLIVIRLDWVSTPTLAPAS